jgi:NOL1/NOP2/sun family putative RNA methylase
MIMSDIVLPEIFIERLRAMLSEELFSSVLASFSLERPTIFRINTLKAKPQDVKNSIQNQSINIEALPQFGHVFMVPPEQRRALTETFEYKAGYIYIQSLASMLVPMVLAPESTDWVLDLAAAPGSKTLQIAEMMHNQGRISAVEPVKSRFFRLRQNLDHHGVTNTKFYMKDGRTVWRQCNEWFDRVLIDAPCSSESRFSIFDPKSLEYWSLQKIKEMQRKQKSLLQSAIRCAKPGGIIVYATCTFAPEENEAVVHEALQQFPGLLEIEQISLPIKNQMPGLEQWNGISYSEGLKHCVRILPDQLMPGFFICKLRKNLA